MAAAAAAATTTTTPTTCINTQQDSSSQKARRESASQIDEFFEEAVDQSDEDASAARFCMLNENRDWEDITTSLTKIDPDNAEMLDLGQSLLKTNQTVKMEPCDVDCPMSAITLDNQSYTHSSLLCTSSVHVFSNESNYTPAASAAAAAAAAAPAADGNSAKNLNNNLTNNDVVLKLDSSNRFSDCNGFLPPTPPSSDPGSPAHEMKFNRQTPPPPYPAPPVGGRTKVSAADKSSTSHLTGNYYYCSF